MDPVIVDLQPVVSSGKLEVFLRLAELFLKEKPIFLVAY